MQQWMAMELMQLMSAANLFKVFMGLEKPNHDSLVECGKKQNTAGSLTEFVDTIHRLGIVSRTRFRYSKLIVKTFCVKRRALPIALELDIHGFYFEKVLERVCRQ